MELYIRIEETPAQKEIRKVREEAEQEKQKTLRDANERADRAAAERDALLDDLAALVEEVFESDLEMMEE